MWNNLNPFENGHPKTHTMSEDRLNRLKAILAVPTASQREKLATKYIVDFCQEHEFDCIVDNLGSVLITKGEIKENEFYPCLAAHTDTVHGLNPKEIREQDNILTAWDHDKQVGIGGDDLAGCFAALELLLILPVVKVGLFVSEEIGCIGSRNAITFHADWFKDIGYVIEFDGPEDYMITQVCSGVELFDMEGEFLLKSLPLLKESMGEKMRFFNHPYTDVSVIKRSFNFSCINVSAGYFNYHSSKEYVVISEAEKAVILGEKLVNALGNQYYEYITKDNDFGYQAWWQRKYNDNSDLWD